MFQRLTGPSSGEANTKYARKVLLKWTEVSLLHTYIYRILKEVYVTVFFQEFVWLTFRHRASSI